MSHAWNACGANAPRGFKSHILRSITPVLSQSRGFALRRPPPGRNLQKNSAPHHPDWFNVAFPTPPPNRGVCQPKTPFPSSVLGDTCRGRKSAPIIRRNGHQVHPRKGEKSRESGAKITPTPRRPAHIFGIWNDGRFHISPQLPPQNWVSHVSSSSSGELQWRYAQ